MYCGNIAGTMLLFSYMYNYFPYKYVIFFNLKSTVWTNE